MNEILQKAATKRKAKTAEVKKVIKNKVADKKKQLTQNTVTSNKLELLVTVVARSKAEYYTDLLYSFEVNLQMTVMAQGTADAKMLMYLGLNDADKAVIFSVIQQNKLPDALAVLDKKFKTIKDGKGIAFTIPLTSVIGTLIFGFLSNNKTVVKENK